jgi:hypothetical protein
MRALFVGGPVDGQVLNFGSDRLVMAEWPEEFDTSYPPRETTPLPRQVLYTIGKFGRSPEQWIWVGYPVGSEPPPAEVWAALLKPGNRHRLMGDA